MLKLKPHICFITLIMPRWLGTSNSMCSDKTFIYHCLCVRHILFVVINKVITTDIFASQQWLTLNEWLIEDRIICCLGYGEGRHVNECQLVPGLCVTGSMLYSVTWGGTFVCCAVSYTTHSHCLVDCILLLLHQI